MGVFLLAPDPNGVCCDCSTRTEPCDSCGGTCSCALLIPPPGGSPPYTSAAAAQTAIDYQAAHASNETCIGFIAFSPSSGTGGLFVDTSVANTVDLGIAASSVASVTEWISLNLVAGSTLTITYTTNNDPGTTFQLYDCLGAFLYGGVMPGGSGAISIPPAIITADAEYWLSITIVSTGGGGPGTANGEHVVTSDDTLTVNPMVAIWDDSGTHRPLEACPVYEMGIGGAIITPSFASEAAAQTALASANVSNCVGYMSSGGPITLVSFTATDGGTSLVLNGSVTSLSTASGVSTKGCINLQAGTNLSVSWSASSGAGGFVSFAASLFLIDYSGNILFSTGQTGTSGSTNFTAPYTGKYYVASDVNGQHVVETNHDVTANVTWSSTVFSVNPIVALYANGDNCPSRLACTP